MTAWGRDRAEAIRRMRRALGEFKIAGVQTNIPMHLQVMHSDAFLEGEFNTTFLETALDLQQPVAHSGDEDAALATAAVLAYLGHGRSSSSTTLAPETPAVGAWRQAARTRGLGSRRSGSRPRGWRSTGG